MYGHKFKVKPINMAGFYSNCVKLPEFRFCVKKKRVYQEMKFFFASITNTFFI